MTIGYIVPSAIELSANGVRYGGAIGGSPTGTRVERGLPQ
jgi:hypothetical protein